MDNHINIIAFGTFGNPNGFNQSFFSPHADPHLARSIKTFDLKTDAIKLFPKSRVYSLRREQLQEKVLVACSVYTFAKEQHSERGGTFIGSSLLFIDEIAEEGSIITYLNELHSSLENRNVRNDTITVSHSRNFDVVPPKGQTRMIASLKKISQRYFVENTHRHLVVFCETHPIKLKEHFRKALALLSVYDTVYFTDSHEVAKFVNDKGLFQLIQDVGDRNDLDIELKKLEAEKRNWVEALLKELEKEKQIIDNDRSKFLQASQNQIIINEKNHEENGKSIEDYKKRVSAIGKKYVDYSVVIEDLINRLKEGNDPDTVGQFYKERKQVYIENIVRQDSVMPISLLHRSKERTSVEVHELPFFPDNDIGKERYSFKKKKRKDFIGYQLASILFFLLWVITGGYFIFFTDVGNENMELGEGQAAIEESTAQGTAAAGPDTVKISDSTGRASEDTMR